MTFRLDLKIGDKQWSLGKVGYMIRIEAEKHIREQRMSDFRNAIRDAISMEFSESNALITQAFTTLLRSTIVDRYDVNMWLQSDSGAALMFHEAMKVYHPDISRDDCLALYNQLTKEQFFKVDHFLHCCLTGEDPDAKPDEEFTPKDESSGGEE